MTAHSELVAWLEGASEGSRELDVMVGRAFNFPMVSRWGDHDWRPDGVGIWSALPKFSTSLDAALALAERVHPCWSWSVGQNVHSKSWLAYALALDADRSSFQPASGSGDTPALAMCIAILRAQPQPDGEKT